MNRLPRRAGCRCFWLAAALAAAHAASAATYLQLVGGWKKEGPERRLQQKLLFSNARVQYGLVYDVSVGPNTPKGRCFSHQWVYTVGVPSLGMSAPATCNWYYQGFFDVQLGGESLKDYLAKVRVVRNGGPDSLAEFEWRTSKGVVRAFFLLRSGDDKLLVRVEWDCPKPPESVVVKLLCYPCWFRGPKDRWIVTAKREVRHSRKAKLDPAAEPWVFYHDRAPRPQDAKGACALMYCPDEVVSAEVDVQSYPNWTRLELKPWRRRATFALWDFTNAGDDAANLAYLRQGGARLLDDLTAAAYADWSRPFTQVVQLPAGRARMLGGRMKFEPTPFDVITPTVETPHRVWAKPLAGGPVKVLCLAPRWSQREMAEIAERFDVQYDVASVDRPNVFFERRWFMLYGTYQLYGYRDRNIVTMLGEMLDKLRGRYDCIIVADVLARILPGYFIDLLRDKVRGGTGLLVTGGGKTVATALGKQGLRPARFHAILPIAALPVLRDFAWTRGKGKPDLARAFRFGKGRILWLNYPVSFGANMSLTPNTTRALDFQPADYEYYQSLVAKGVLWAAGRTPAARITSLSPGRLAVECARAFPRAEVVVAMHDRAGRLTAGDRSVVSLAKGANTLPLRARPTWSGECFVDVRLLADGKTLDWASLAYEVKGPARVERVELSKTVLKPGEPVEGTVKLSGVNALSRVELRVVDAWGRVECEGEAPAAAGEREVRFALPRARSLSIVHRVEAYLYQGWTPRGCAAAEFTTPDRSLDDFMFLMWSKAHNSYVRLAVLRQLARHGVDTLDIPGLTQASGPQTAAACRNAAWARLRSVPYVTRIATRAHENLARRPCLTDPEYLKSWTAGLRERARAAAAYGPPAYTLGDENFLIVGRVDICRSPTCLAGFRDYLKRTYRTLDALNAEWGTKLTSWDEATPLTFEEAKRSGQWPRWVDHRRFMEQVFTRAHALGRRAIREADPGARVGFDGIFSLDSWHGYDFYQLCRACDLNEVYGLRYNQIEYVRCFGPKGALKGAWHNRIGNADEVSAKRMPWQLLFHGFNSSWYWMSYETPPGALFPDLRPTPQMKWMEESHNEIKAGVGKLLLHARRLQDGVAIHYSQASVHGDAILERKLSDAHLGAMFAVEDLGLQYDFVAYEQVEQGALDRYKVFVMPESCAVSRKEVEAIRRFVRRGGLVVADVSPAVMDAHGKRLKRGALDDVFGAAASLRAAASMPAAGRVALRGHPFGKGRGILLGYPFSDYAGLRNEGKEAAFREALRAALAAQGVAAAVRITTAADGKPAPACEVVRFRSGDIEYVGVVSEDNLDAAKPVDAVIAFSRAAHAYDVRGKRYLGRVAQTRTKILPGVPLLYALLPYAVERVTLQADKRTYRPGERAALRVRIETSAGRLAGAHVARIEVVDAKGRLRPECARNALTGQPSVSVSIPFAFNDPPGEWRVTATDVASGRRAAITLRLAGP